MTETPTRPGESPVTDVPEQEPSQPQEAPGDDPGGEPEVSPAIPGEPENAPGETGIPTPRGARLGELQAFRRSIGDSQRLR